MSRRFFVGYAQPFTSLDRLAVSCHLLIDLRAASMNQDRADAHGVEQQYILGEAARAGRVGHWQAADLDHDRLAGEAADIGQRLVSRGAVRRAMVMTWRQFSFDVAWPEVHGHRAAAAAADSEVDFDGDFSTTSYVLLRR